MYKPARTSGQEGPSKIAMDVARDVADEESNETKSLLADHAEACNGNENAIPGYDKT